MVRLACESVPCHSRTSWSATSSSKWATKSRPRAQAGELYIDQSLMTGGRTSHKLARPADDASGKTGPADVPVSRHPGG